MRIITDWHIHSRNSCDEASLVMADLVTQASEKGIQSYGITDHLHTPHNVQDILASREEYLACRPERGFHFGIELSVVSVWELDELRVRQERYTYGIREGGPEGAEPSLGASAESLQVLGVEYVVAGVHWPLYLPPDRNAIIADYHRQNMFLATHPLVDIIAHPWWWMGYWKDPDGRYTTDPWLDDFGKIPGSMHDEFATAAVEHGKAVEINLSATLMNPSYPESFGPQYLEYLADLAAKGVTFSIGSDCHSATYAPDFDRAGAMLDSIGLVEEDFWRLADREQYQIGEPMARQRPVTATPRP